MEVMCKRCNAIFIVGDKIPEIECNCNGKEFEILKQAR